WPHRLHGRPHRAVAGAGRRRPPCPRRLRRTGRARAGPRVAVVVDVLAPVIVVVLLAIVVIVVSAPLRRGVTADDERLAARVGDLEAAKEAKYREIRDAELDFRTGKLSEADWRMVDRELRAEAMDLLRELDAFAP